MKYGEDVNMIFRLSSINYAYNSTLESIRKYPWKYHNI